VWGLTAGIGITALCGLIILISRFFNKVQKEISNPDDFISNLLVTVFQILTIGMLHFDIPMLYFLWASLLLLYLPFGKLKHVVYFFAARYHLGFFYGWRGSWPPKK
jgi:nitrate reductase gamma subunit